MKKFLIVLCIVLLSIGVLAACAPLHNISDDVQGFAKTLPAKGIPDWVIIVGAVVVFFIGVGIIWKLIPGFIKFIALLVLAIAVAGAAYGLWKIPAYDKARDIYHDVIETPAESQE